MTYHRYNSDKCDVWWTLNNPPIKQELRRKYFGHYNSLVCNTLVRYLWDLMCAGPQKVRSTDIAPDHHSLNRRTVLFQYKLSLGDIRVLGTTHKPKFQ